MHYAKRVSSEGMIKDNNKILVLYCRCLIAFPYRPLRFQPRQPKRKKKIQGTMAVLPLQRITSLNLTSLNLYMPSSENQLMGIEAGLQLFL